MNIVLGTDPLEVPQILSNANIKLVGGVIQLPKDCSRIKLDVGLSSNAPQACVWLEQDPQLVVFGFEPVAENVRSIRSGSSSWPTKVDPTLVDSRLFVIPAALADVHPPQRLQMHVTAIDTGRSSLLTPQTFEIAYTEAVDAFRLSDFLKLLPWHAVSVIDHLKTDCQGSDLDVLRSAGSWIHQILAITAEPEDQQYRGSQNSSRDIKRYLQRRGFLELSRAQKSIPRGRVQADVDDPTYVNMDLLPEIGDRVLRLYQRG